MTETRQHYPLFVDYEKKLEEFIGEGRYDWIDPRINSQNFTSKKKGKNKILVTLVKFNRPTSSGEAINKLNQMGYRPLILQELLAFSESYPHVQRDKIIVSLGSSWQDERGDRLIPYLSNQGDEKRELHLGWYKMIWNEKCDFAAAYRKQK